MQTKKLLTLFLSILLLMSTFLANAQNKASISGVVKDGSTGDILIGTNVYFKGTSIGGITDIDGKFLITNIPVGEYVLMVSYIGYETYKENLTINAGDNIKKIIKLQYSGGVNLQDVTVTAQARGQIAAINQQLQATDIKNVVSADRIQELPDANAAESLGRLPGVSVTRSGGEGSKVVIRGMSPKYNKVMIDGIEVASTGSDDRSTNLSMISSYSLDGIEVVKSNTADLDGDFVGGSVNFKLKTASDGFHVDVVALGSYNQLKSTVNNYNFVASVSNRFLDNKLGIFAMGNFESRIRSGNEREVETWFVKSDQSLTEPNPVWPSKLFLLNTNRTRKRSGGTLVFDYRLNNGSIAFKNFISSGKDNIQEFSQNYNVNERNVNFKTKDATYDVLTLNNLLKYEQQFGVFKVYGKLGHSFSKSSSPNDLSLNFLEFASLPGIPRNDASLHPDSIVSYHTYNPSSMYARNFNNWNRNTEQRQYEVSADVEWAFSLSEQVTGKIKVGGKYRRRNKYHDETRNFADVSESTSGGAFNRVLLSEFPQMVPYVDDPNSAIRIPFSAYMDKDYVPDEFMKGKYGDIMKDIADIYFMHEVYDFVSNTDLSGASSHVYRLDDPDSKQFDYKGSEDLYAGYIMGTFKITSFVDFIPGARYETNNTSYTGPRGDMRATDAQRIIYGDYKDTTTTRNNGYWLPMIHLKVKPLDWLQVRMAYTKTLARPDYKSLVPKQHIISGSENVVIQHRFDLDPEMSNNFDFNVSVHENHVGLFTVGLFAKNIEDKIFWTGKKLIGDKYPDYGLDQTLQSYNINTQYNDSNIVKVRGIELDWQTTFWYLPGAFKGLVLNINYTHINSEAIYPYTVYRTVGVPPFQNTEVIDTSYTDRLIDQPNDILNISLGYDYKGFSARVSMMYTNDIFTENSRYYDTRGYKDKFTRWDISLKQQLPIEGLQVFMNLNNITGAVDEYYIRGASYPVREEHYGMTIDLGLRWQL